MGLEEHWWCGGDLCYVIIVGAHVAEHYYVHCICWLFSFEFSYKLLRNTHSFLSILQKMSSANDCFSVEGTWETNMAFLAEYNEETPKGWWKVLVLKEDFLPISLTLISTLSHISTLSSPPSHLHPLISNLSTPIFTLSTSSPQELNSST